MICFLNPNAVFMADSPSETASTETAFPLQPTARNSRRGFLRTLGGTALAGGAFATVSGCDTDNDDDGNDTVSVTLDFNNAVDVLNYAFVLEQLEAAFYARAVQAMDEDGLDLGSEPANDYFRDLAAHEDIHQQLFATAIGAQNGRLIGISNFLTLEEDFDFENPDAVLEMAQTLEDTGVSAYNGAGIYLAGNDTFLTLAGKIVSVEGRHASAIRALTGGPTHFADLDSNFLTDLNANPDFALGVAQSPSDVLGAVASTGLLSEDLQINTTNDEMDVPNTSS